MTFRDADQDTLLHIVIRHKDYAKTYTLVEQAIKFDKRFTVNWFNTANKNLETPLSIANSMNSSEIVNYLIEAGLMPKFPVINGNKLKSVPLNNDFKLTRYLVPYKN